MFRPPPESTRTDPLDTYTTLFDTRAARQSAADAAAKAASSQVAYGGTTDGKEIYDHLCTSCHTAGIAGAPKLGDKAMWGPRIKEGIDVLVKHAIQGYHGPDGNFMPPKGGNPALTDAPVARKSVV